MSDEAVVFGAACGVAGGIAFNIFMALVRWIVRDELKRLHRSPTPGQETRR